MFVGELTSLSLEKEREREDANLGKYTGFIRGFPLTQ